MQSRTAQKLTCFLAALVLFVMVAGADIGSRIITKAGVGYALGAFIAFWTGRETFGLFHKVNPRPICIGVGTLMMVAMFILMLLGKEMLHHHD